MTQCTGTGTGAGIAILASMGMDSMGLQSIYTMLARASEPRKLMLLGYNTMLPPVPVLTAWAGYLGVKFAGVGSFACYSTVFNTGTRVRTRVLESQVSQG